MITPTLKEECYCKGKVDHFFTTSYYKINVGTFHIKFLTKNKTTLTNKCYHADKSCEKILVNMVEVERLFEAILNRHNKKT